MSLRLPDLSDQQAFAKFSTKQWHSLDGYYHFWVQRWRQELEFIRSQHWNKTLYVPEQNIPLWEEFPTVDITTASYADYLKQWLQSKVRFSATPDSPTPKEINSAQLADHVLRYLWDRYVNKLRPDIGAWLMATGNADVRVFWNTNTGNTIPLAIPDPQDPTGQSLIPINPDTLQPDPTMQQPMMLDEGDIGVEVISPQLVRWPFDTSHGCQVGFLLTYDEACARFGDQMANKLHYQKGFAGVSVDLLTFNITGPTHGAEEDKALVIEHYLPRSYKYPTGLWWTACDNQLITPPGPLPTGKLSELPVIHFRWIPMPGHPVLGLSPLHGVRNLNKLYEKGLKRTMEWQNKIVPKRLKPNGSGIRDGEMSTAEPGQEISYNAGAEPKYDQMPQVPETFEKLRAEHLQNLKNVGLYQFRSAMSPVPGQALQSPRQPQDMIGEGQEVALAVMNSKDSWERMAYVLLGYVATYYTEPRTLNIVGPDRTYQWREFSGSDLANLRATIRVDEISLYTWNRESVRDTVMGLLSTPAGQMLFTGPDGQLDRDRIQQALTGAGLDEGFDLLDPDVLEARNEISMFAGLQDPPQPPQGVDPQQAQQMQQAFMQQQAQNAPQVQPWQNHDAHLSEKYKVIKGMEFRGWPQTAQGALMNNISGHEQAKQQQVQQAQAQQVQQEAAMRGVKANADAASATRSALGEAMVQLLQEALSVENKVPGKGKSK